MENSRMTSIQGYQALVIAKALEMYARYGMTPNRAYTPTNMLATASRITGIKFKRGQYLDAANALHQFAEGQ
jgi:hypothetical protein